MIILKKIKIVEYNRYHYELLPTWIQLISSFTPIDNICLFMYPGLARKGLSSFFSQLPNFRSIFVTDPSRGIVLRMLRLPIALLLRGFIRFKGYPDINDQVFLKVRGPKKDLLVFNSIEPQNLLKKAEFFAGKGYRIVVVLHNGNLIHNNSYRLFLQRPNVYVFVLSGMVKKYLQKAGFQKANLFAPQYFNYKPRNDISERISFAVQGSVFFDRRNYDSLINAINFLVNRNNETNFLVKIIGNSMTDHGKIIREEILKKQIEGFFVFFDYFLDYNEFYNEFDSCDYVLALQDRMSIMYSPYFEYKCSSTINQSLGFNKIAILHEEQSILNGLEGISITYRDGQLAEAMSHALKQPVEDRELMKAMIKERRKHLLKISRENVERVLNE